MDKTKLQNAILSNNEAELVELLNMGLDPNFQSGNLIRCAARYGASAAVKLLLQYGADPHLMADSGASTLQLAVYSGKHWEGGHWDLLVSCCDSSQLADGAAVAIVFNNIEALRTILRSGRCNVNVPTSLTGKTVDELAKGYKLSQLLEYGSGNLTPTSSPRRAAHFGSSSAPLAVPTTPNNRSLSPSVARFFRQTALLSPNQQKYRNSPNH